MYTPSGDPQLVADQQAATLLNSCKVELLHWVDSNRIRLPDDKMRGEFADYMTHKYLSNQLDTLLSSKTVTKVRKEVSFIIEQFANDAIIANSVLQMKARHLSLPENVIVSTTANPKRPSSPATTASSGSARRKSSERRRQVSINAPVTAAGAAAAAKTPC